MAGFLPVVPLFQGAFRIDEDVRYVLDVANFPFASTHFEQGIVGGALNVGRIEQERSPESSAPAGGQPPILAFDVVDDCRTAPREQRRHHQTDSLARTCRCEAQHMLRTMMAEIGAAPTTQQHPVGVEKPGLANLARLRPARGAIRRDLLHFPRTPDRHCGSHDEGCDAASARDEAAGDEDVVGISVISEPPPEEGLRLIHRPPKEGEPGVPELRLEGQLPSGQLCRRPNEAEHGGEDEQSLDPKDLCRVHRDEGSAYEIWASASRNSAVA